MSRIYFAGETSFSYIWSYLVQEILHEKMHGLKRRKLDSNIHWCNFCLLNHSNSKFTKCIINCTTWNIVVHIEISTNCGGGGHILFLREGGSAIIYLKHWGEAWSPKNIRKHCPTPRNQAPIAPWGYPHLGYKLTHMILLPMCPTIANNGIVLFSFITNFIIYWTH